MVLLFAPLLLMAVVFYFQQVFPYGDALFYPDYEQVDLIPILSQESLSDADYETLYLQTGLSPYSVDVVLAYATDPVATIQASQEAFYAEVTRNTVPLIDYFTQEDRLVDENGEVFLGPGLHGIQPGDILLTLSTQTMGWRHGHAGLVVVDENGDLISLEAIVMGQPTTTNAIGSWQGYSQYILLRPTGQTYEEGLEVANYAMENLLGIPYHLTSGFIGEKAPDIDDTWFGVQCSYLVWYAYQAFGLDLDSDGGRLVSTADILGSSELEVVALYGVDPREYTPIW